MIKHVLRSLSVFEGLSDSLLSIQYYANSCKGEDGRFTDSVSFPLIQAAVSGEVFQHFRHHKLEWDDYRNLIGGQ